MDSVQAELDLATAPGGFGIKSFHGLQAFFENQKSLEMIAPSRAGEFFNRIVNSSDPVKTLEDLVSFPTNAGESEFVDYKAAGDRNFNDDTIKETWSVALSGFGNTGGGVLIFGIRAANNAPTALSLVKDVDVMEARLKQLQPNATDPPIHGAEIRVFRQKPISAEGFVVCFIPPSAWRPHMAIWGDHKYYIRSGDNCIPASHSILKTLFQPERVAQLSVFGRLIKAPEQMGCISLVLKTWLHNAGPATAKDSLLLYEMPKITALSGVDFNRNDWRPFSSGLKGEGLSAKRSILPEEMYPIIGGDLARYVKGAKDAPKPPFVFTFRVFSEDKPPILFELTFTKDDVATGGTVKATQTSS